MSLSESEPPPCDIKDDLLVLLLKVDVKIRHFHNKCVWSIIQSSTLGSFFSEWLSPFNVIVQSCTLPWLLDGENVTLDFVAELCLKVTELLFKDIETGQNDGFRSEAASRLHVVEELVSFPCWIKRRLGWNDKKINTLQCEIADPRGLGG